MARCLSRDPYSGDLQCTKDAGHEDEQHVFGGIAWTYATEPMTSLTLTRSEIGLAIKAVSRLWSPFVGSPEGEDEVVAAALLRKLAGGHDKTERP